MIEFRTLGTVDLRDPDDGHGLDAILSRSKRVALLAYLALARPRGFHRRDSLFGLFWPEVSDERARRALNQSAYVLRKALGDGFLVSLGDEELGLDADRPGRPSSVRGRSQIFRREVSIMKTTRTKRAVWPLALLATTFLLGCQEQASSPTGPEGSGPLFTHKEGQEHGKKGGGGGGGGGEDPTAKLWSKAFARVHGQTSFVLGNTKTLQSDTDDSLVDGCFGFPGAKTSNPTVEWNDEPGGETEGSTNGCAQVTTTDGTGTLLTNDAYLIVGMKKGSTKYTIQFQIQDVGGPDGIQYRTDKFVVDNVLNGPFTGAGFTLHVHSTVEIWKLKGHTGGPKVASAGDIYIGDIVYN